MISAPTHISTRPPSHIPHITRSISWPDDPPTPLETVYIEVCPRPPGLPAWAIPSVEIVSDNMLVWWVWCTLLYVTVYSWPGLAWQPGLLTAAVQPGSTILLTDGCWGIMLLVPLVPSCGCGCCSTAFVLLICMDGTGEMRQWGLCEDGVKCDNLWRNSGYEKLVMVNRIWTE